MGLMLKALQQDLIAVDDRTVRWVLKKPYPKMLMALGKNSTPMAFIMPERIAKTDPFTQINEYVGSGPMRFKKDEWVPGARAVFEKFADYVPRDEPGSWLAGGKRMGVDRIEWLVMPDPATASAALQNGEVDWWENPITDLIPQLKRNRNIARRHRRSARQYRHVPDEPSAPALQQPEGAAGGDGGAEPGRLHARPGRRRRPDVEEAAGLLHPRHAALHREWRRDPQGPEHGPAKRLLAESGYSGTPVTCVVAQDQPITKAQGDVTADLLKRIGFNVDYVATDWGTTGQRRAMKNPVGQGGWNMFHSWHAGARLHQPGGLHRHPRAMASSAWFGWPDVPAVETEVDNWFEAPDLAAEKAAIARLNKAAVDNVALRADRLLPRLPGLAGECLGRGEGAAALLLGRLEVLTGKKVARCSPM